MRSTSPAPEDDTLTEGTQQRQPAAEPLLWRLVIAASPDVGSIGFTASLPREGTPRLLGRGPRREEDPANRLEFGPQRPVGPTAPGGPLQVQALSRAQAILRPGPSGVGLEVLGRTPTYINGVELTEGRLKDGDVLRFGDELCLLLTLRPRSVAAPNALASQLGSSPFGAPDPIGLVGESTALWALREQLVRVAALDEHTLVLGPSGTGKELVARGLATLSRRHKGPFVSRNAATLPPTLIDAELFGNIRDYPNPGMKARGGLIGEADGGVLFLDEIGELPGEQQAHLLRVLDAGEYQQLGEGRVRRSDFRFVGATNRDIAELKSDFGARIYLRLEMPPLNDRREDIPLLTRHLLTGLGRTSPRVDARLMEGLLRHRYSLHIRELRGLLLAATTSSPDAELLTLTPEVAGRLVLPTLEQEPDLETIRHALEQSGGNTTRAAERLGLANRYVLYRLMKKHGLQS